MKKVIVALMMCAIINTIAATTIAEVYPQTFLVIEVNCNNDIVTMIDFNGNEWIIEGAEDWMEGDIASAIMEDNNTITIYDDEIITLRYSGFIY